MDEQQVWIIPGDPNDMAPLPALRHGNTLFSVYNRRQQAFGNVYEHSSMQTYDTFELCRAAMIVERSAMLEDLNKHCRHIAQSIEHIRTIPPAPFPNVSREVREQGQQQEKAKGPEEKAQGRQEEVKQAKPELKQRPPRRN